MILYYFAGSLGLLALVIFSAGKHKQRKKTAL